MDNQILQNIITDFSNLHSCQKSRKQTTSPKALSYVIIQLSLENNWIPVQSHITQD